MSARVVSLTAFRQRKAALKEPHCGICYDATGEVYPLVKHKIWGGDVGHSCPNCNVEF